MPQMSPMNWLFLFLYFVLMMILITMFIYFNYTLKSDIYVDKKSMVKLNWMW